MVSEPGAMSPVITRRWTEWATLAILIVVGVFLLFFRLGSWSWDKDEVPSLVELGVIDLDSGGQYGTQIERLPRLVPVWYTTQRIVLRFLPINEFGTRILSAVCGVVTVVLVYWFGRAWRGFWFGLALALLVGFNQCFVWLAQQNRFYSMALMFLVGNFFAVWLGRRSGVVASVAAAGLAGLAVLSHNLTAVVLWIGGIAAVICLPLGFVPRSIALRSLISAAVALLIYAIYLTPIMDGWLSGGTGGTNELVSFAAQAGMPTIALAFVGMAWSWRKLLSDEGLCWWLLMLIGGTGFIGLSPVLMGNWNARYALLFMLPYWVFAAIAVERVALMMTESWNRAAWFACVALLLMPKLLSHYRDGTRHDFRGAAQRIAARATVDDRIFCDFPMTLEYYLHQLGGFQVDPQFEFFKAPTSGWVVIASNAYEPLLQVAGYDCRLTDKLAIRRFDEQSHVIWIFRVVAKSGPHG